MLVKRIWLRRIRWVNDRLPSSQMERHGWFLFGFIPLYIVDVRVH